MRDVELVIRESITSSLSLSLTGSPSLFVRELYNKAETEAIAIKNFAKSSDYNESLEKPGPGQILVAYINGERETEFHHHSQQAQTCKLPNAFV